MSLFDLFPLGALINKEILCIHGGLSPLIHSIDSIKEIDRKVEIPKEGPFCDLMWSDPDEEVKTWKRSSRGCGWLFGEKVTKEFNH